MTTSTVTAALHQHAVALATATAPGSAKPDGVHKFLSHITTGDWVAAGIVLVLVIGVWRGWLYLGQIAFFVLVLAVAAFFVPGFTTAVVKAHNVPAQFHHANGKSSQAAAPPHK